MSESFLRWGGDVSFRRFLRSKTSPWFSASFRQKPEIFSVLKHFWCFRRNWSVYSERTEKRPRRVFKTIRKRLDFGLFLGLRFEFSLMINLLSSFFFLSQRLTSVQGIKGSRFISFIRCFFCLLRFYIFPINSLKESLPCFSLNFSRLVIIWLYSWFLNFYIHLIQTRLFPHWFSWCEHSQNQWLHSWKEEENKVNLRSKVTGSPGPQLLCTSCTCESLQTLQGGKKILMPHKSADVKTHMSADVM